MKKSNRSKKLLVLILSIVYITSCEHTDVNSDIIETANEEDFINSSENNNATFEKESENVEIVLHMSFDSTVSKEEALAQFEKATKEYVAKDEQMGKSASHKFRYQIITKTGNGEDHGTDGIVHTRIWFQTDSGPRKYIKRLDNPNKNDFEKGKTDYFLLEVTPSTPVCFVIIDANNSAIGLKGTDNWGLKRFTIRVIPQMQIKAATGQSIQSFWVNKVLDSPSSNLWDKHVVGPNGQYPGILNFNCN